MRWLVLCVLLLACAPPAPEDVGTFKAALSSTVGWAPADGGGFVNQDQVDGAAVGLHLLTNPPTAGAHLGEVSRDQADLRAPANAGTGPGVVGLYIGNRGTAQSPVWVDPGTATMEGLSGLAKYAPVVISTPYVYWNGRGSAHTGGTFAAVTIPHSGIGSDGAVSLHWVATLWTDGAPDINPDLSVDTSLPGEGSYAIRANGDAVYFGGTLVWGQPENGTNSYEDCASGSSAPVSGSGHIRRACDTTTGKMGFNINVDGDAHWQPLPVAMQGFFNTGTGYGTPTQAYPSGETILTTWTPNAARGAGEHGLRSWDPKLWNLPPAQTVTGGSLRACLRFHVSSGSSQLMCNTTGASVITPRDTVFLALAGQWIDEVRAVAVNTSSTTTASRDIGLIQFEGTAF